MADPESVEPKFPFPEEFKQLILPVIEKYHPTILASIEESDSDSREGRQPIANYIRAAHPPETSQ